MKRKKHNPASSASQYGAAQAVLSGRSRIMPRAVAKELIDATPARLREKFARELAARRNPSKRAKRSKGSKGAHRRRRVNPSAGDRVTFRGRFGALRTGRVVMRSSDGGWVLNMGGKHGTPEVIQADQIVKVSKGRQKQTMRSRSLFGNPRGKKKTHRRRRRSNPADAELRAAEKMFHKFTGRKAKGYQTVEQLRVLPSALADCGRMVEMSVHRPGVKDLLHFNGTGVRVGTTGNGGQLYFVKGDQSMSLAGIPHEGKDHVDLGTAHRIVYFTSKDFHNFEPSEYSHKFGEENGIRPTLHYDVRSRRLYLTGGDYRVKREGIVN